jgi:hypothetical protein
MNIARRALNHWHLRHVILLVLNAVVLISCSKPAPPPAVDRLATCLPVTESDEKVRLAIEDVYAGKDETRVRVVAYAGAEPGVFALPVYYLSRGRWLIAEKDRSYILDPQCRQYNLHDRHDAKWTDAPPDGKVTLKPGTAFETVLDFPPLAPNTTRGVLVYGSYVIPFSALPSESSK